MASFVWTGGGGRCGSGSPAGVPLRLRLRQRGGAAMRRTFEVRRETSEQPDGQARWDRAYQLVFGWAATPVAAANADSRTAIAYAGIASCGSVNPFAPKPVGRYCGRRIGVMSLYTNGRWSKPCDRRSVRASPPGPRASDPAGQGRLDRRPRHRRHDALVFSEPAHAAVGLTAPEPLPGTGCR